MLAVMGKILLLNTFFCKQKYYFSTYFQKTFSNILFRYFTNATRKYFKSSKFVFQDTFYGGRM